jgi:hypothetical protein
MANNRLYYAIYQVGFARIGTSAFVAAKGVQSVGLTTSFNVTPVFQVGQLAVYDLIENVPDVEVQMEKVLDGTCPLYLLATWGATSSNIGGRSTMKTTIGMSYFDESLVAATGTPVSQVTMSGMAISSASWAFSTDGEFRESVTLVGNDKVWKLGAPFTFSGAFNSNVEESPVSITGSGGVNTRADILFTPTVATLDANGMVADPDATILPRQLPGISASGTNDVTLGQFGAHLSSINVSTDFGRDQIFELGRKAPYYRFTTFPIEVKCDIEMVSRSGDLVSATEAGIYAGGTNLRNETIRIATKEGTRINLGTKNKMNSCNTTGGDTGGGNVTMSYSFINYNFLTVEHWNDITTALAPSQGGSF